MTNRIEVENGSCWLPAEGLDGSTINGIENNLQGRGSLLEASASLTVEDRSTLMKSMGLFAAQRVAGISPELINRDLSDAKFLGGVCALSTREGKLLRDRIVEDPLTGGSILMGEGADELSDVVTAVQAFEAIGLTSNASSIILEDKFWTERVVQMLAEKGLRSKAISEKANKIVRSRNRQTFNAVERLRAEITGSANEIDYFSDELVVDELKTRTNVMLGSLGLEANDPSDYKYVYAGMYSYVWRDVLESAGIVKPDQLAIIFEPTKHIGQEDGVCGKISRFKSAIVEVAPYLKPGSLSEQVGLIAYMEPRDPSGRIFRDNVPTALVPNSLNYNNFDFSRFPVVPKKAQGLPEISEFKFLDQMGDTALGKNPAFLWGLAYPPTTRSVDVMEQMVSLSRSRRETVIAAMKDPGWFSDEALSMTKPELSFAVTKQFSYEMMELANELVIELQRLTAVMFEDKNAVK